MKVVTSFERIFEDRILNFLLKFTCFPQIRCSGEKNYVPGIQTLERLRNENEDKTKTQMTQSFNQYSENETKIWRQNILN